MGKKAKTPAAPDYTKLAHEQAALDKEAIGEATTANRVNQTNPFGSLSWQQDPTTGQWSQDVSLNAADQGNLDQMRGITGNLTGQAANAMSSPFDISGAPDMPDSGFGAVQEVQDAMMSRMAPDLLRNRQRQEAQLVAQGVGGNTNSASWDRAQSDLGRNENDASMQALLAGAKEYGNIYDRGMGNRNQWLEEQNAMRQMPLNELTAMLRNQQTYAAPQFENFYNQSAGAGADILGAGQQQYGAAMDAANAKNAARSNTLGTIGKIGGAVAGIFSDLRLKDNINRIGSLPNGVGVYRYNIFGNDEIGVLAQELLFVQPSAVITDPITGYFKVDYSQLHGFEEVKNELA